MLRRTKHSERAPFSVSYKYHDQVAWKSLEGVGDEAASFQCGFARVVSPNLVARLPRCMPCI